MLVICDECGKIKYCDQSFLNGSEKPVCEVCGHAVTVLKEKSKDTGLSHGSGFDESCLSPFAFHRSFPQSKFLKVWKGSRNILKWMVSRLSHAYRNTSKKMGLKTRFQILSALIFLLGIFLFTLQHTTVTEGMALYTIPLSSIINGALLMIGLSGWVYALRLAGKLRDLSNSVNQISLGELDNEIDIVSRDELGELAEAVHRMQASLIFASKRLHRGPDNPEIL